jgi:transposase-like protein
MGANSDNMKQQAKELSAVQLHAIEMLMTHASISEAADACGVHRATLHRWMNDATFRDALRQAEADVMQATQRRMATLAASAAEYLGQVLTEPYGYEVNQRLKAAELILSRLARMSAREAGEK